MITLETATIFLSSIISFISIFGASFIVLTYIKFDQLRHFAFKLITFISISDFIFYFGKLLSLLQLVGISNLSLCSIQGVLINFGELASILWTTIVAYTLFLTVTKHETQIEEKYGQKYMRIGFGIPLILTIMYILIYLK